MRRASNSTFAVGSRVVFTGRGSGYPCPQLGDRGTVQQWAFYREGEIQALLVLWDETDRVTTERVDQLAWESIVDLLARLA